MEYLNQVLFGIKTIIFSWFKSSKNHEIPYYGHLNIGHLEDEQLEDEQSEDVQSEDVQSDFSDEKLYNIVRDIDNDRYCTNHNCSDTPSLLCDNCHVEIEQIREELVSELKHRRPWRNDPMMIKNGFYPSQFTE